MQTDLERVLTALIHDLRTPLGVAHGYLRLLHERRLPSEAEQDRALAGTRTALGSMTEICRNAAEAMTPPPTPTDGPVPVDAFVGAVRTQLNLVGTALAAERLPSAGHLRVRGNHDRLAEATGVVLHAAAQARAGAVVSVESRAHTLSFVLLSSDGPADGDVIVALPLETIPA